MTLTKRITELWSSQYRAGEYLPGWYKPLLKFSPTREDVAFSIAKNFHGHLLDIGCGDGDLVIKLSKNYSHLVGIDVVDYRVDRAVKKASKKKLKNVEFRVEDIENGLGVSSEKFDLVICLSVLEYTFDPYFTINEIRRVTKRGGKLILSVPNIGFFSERMRLLFGGLPNSAHAPGWQGGRLHNFTEPSLKKLLTEQGFRINRITGSGFLNNIRSLWPSLFCGDLIFICKRI